MNRIPSDLNQMMWDIADRGDAQAAAEFTEKFPALSDDMKSRMNLVSGMKNAREAIAPKFVPQFRPQYLSKPTPKWRRYAPAALALAALAGASFYITRNLATPLPDPVSLGGPGLETAAPTHGVNLPRVQAPSAPVNEDFDRDAPRPFSPNSEGRPTTTSSWADRRPINIKLTRVHLQNAIAGIAKKFDYQAEIPANLPNPIIDVDMTATEMMHFLNILGNEYGFTAFDAGGGRVYVLLPSKDGAETAPGQ